MATIRKSAQRKTRRVEDTESSGNKAAKEAQHRGTAQVMENGEIEITCQLSELVPVAQYANVTIGPVALRWRVNNPGIDILGDVDWENGGTLSPDQQAVYDTVRGYIRATSKLIEHAIAEDRELVEESVRLHNEREAEEAAAQEKRRRQTSRR